MKRRVADIIFKYLRERGLGHVYTLSGGGIMYLVDALGYSGLKPVFCHHEQGAAIAAQAHAMYANAPACCLVTTGPGGTNALTGCAAAFMDSTPVLFLSGQVKRPDFASLRGVRQFGAQENDIVAMAKPVTKYAVLVEEPENALYEVERALHAAMTGRQGPAWVDIPLDVQGAEVEEGELRRFTPEPMAVPGPDMGGAAENCLERLLGAKRPLILAGHGVIAAKAQEALRGVARKLGVPLVSTWRALELLGTNDPLFFGSPGLQAPRYSNIITQAADFILVLGSRLDNMITAFSEERFGLRAEKAIIDIDPAEIAKLHTPHVTGVVGDAGEFLGALAVLAGEATPQPREAWLGFCRQIKARFPLAKERQPRPSPKVDLYHLAAAIGERSRGDEALVVSSTSRCNTAGHIALPRREGQVSVSSMGLGSMGFALSSVVGAWFASGGQRVICLEGDGSLQLNLQELQTIRHHNIDAKIFVFNNDGYAAIATMQDRNFGGFHVGCDAASGVTMPPLEAIAAAYGFAYFRIDGDKQIQDGVEKTLLAPEPAICECLGDIAFDEIPKCVSTVNEAGKRVSAHLENPFPFLPEAELEGIFAQLEGMQS